MNPPFDRGAEHRYKANEIQQNGGNRLHTNETIEIPALLRQRLAKELAAPQRIDYDGNAPSMTRNAVQTLIWL